jgi:hypothetical protein
VRNGLCVQYLVTNGFAEGAWPEPHDAITKTFLDIAKGQEQGGYVLRRYYIILRSAIRLAKEWVEDLTHKHAQMKACEVAREWRKNMNIGRVTWDQRLATNVVSGNPLTTLPSLLRYIRLLTS